MGQAFPPTMRGAFSANGGDRAANRDSRGSTISPENVINLARLEIEILKSETLRAAIVSRAFRCEESMNSPHSVAQLNQASTVDCALIGLDTTATSIVPVLGARKITGTETDYMIGVNDLDYMPWVNVNNKMAPHIVDNTTYNMLVEKYPRYAHAPFPFGYAIFVSPSVRPLVTISVLRDSITDFSSVCTAAVWPIERALAHVLGSWPSGREGFDPGREVRPYGCCREDRDVGDISY